MNPQCLRSPPAKRCLLDEKFIKVIATGFGSGFAPLAPGTAGTVIGIPIYLLFSLLSWQLYLITLTALSFLAIYVSQEAEKLFGEKDSPRIVIDEIVGFLWTMLLVAPTVLHVLLGFVFFRIFDIAKVYPADYVQDKLPVGYGVVADDVVAGIYSNIILQVLVRVWSI
jgi:phosphatidylglycerophosphatase A